MGHGVACSDCSGGLACCCLPALQRHGRTSRWWLQINMRAWPSLRPAASGCPAMHHIHERTFRPRRWGGRAAAGPGKGKPAPPGPAKPHHAWATEAAAWAPERRQAKRRLFIFQVQLVLNLFVPRFPFFLAPSRVWGGTRSVISSDRGTRGGAAARPRGGAATRRRREIPPTTNQVYSQRRAGRCVWRWAVPNKTAGEAQQGSGKATPNPLPRCNFEVSYFISLACPPSRAPLCRSAALASAPCPPTEGPQGWGIARRPAKDLQAQPHRRHSPAQPRPGAKAACWAAGPRARPLPSPPALPWLCPA